MLTRDNDTIQVNESLADFETMGQVSTDKIGTNIPFYAITKGV